MRKLRKPGSALCILCGVCLWTGSLAFADPQQDLANLQEQLRLAQRNMAEQANEIRLLREDTKRLKEKASALSLELETAQKAPARIQELEAEKNQLQSRLDALQKEFDALQAQVKEKGKLAAIETQTTPARAQPIEKKPPAEKVEAAKPEEKPTPPQPESVESAPEVRGAGQPSREFVPAGNAYVVVQRVSATGKFVVVSLHNFPGAVQGSTLLLSEGHQPVAEVELTDVNASGMAMAFVTRAWQEGLSSLQSGNTLSVRALVSPQEP